MSTNKFLLFLYNLKSEDEENRVVYHNGTFLRNFERRVDNGFFFPQKDFSGTLLGNSFVVEQSQFFYRDNIPLCVKGIVYDDRIEYYISLRTASKIIAWIEFSLLILFVLVEMYFSIFAPFESFIEWWYLVLISNVIIWGSTFLNRLLSTFFHNKEREAICKLMKELCES